MIQEIAHGTSFYQETVALRDLVLRQPLGLCFTAEELAAEHDSFHLGYWHQDRLLACLILKPLEKTIIKVRQFAVHPDFQGQGLGMQLMQHAEAFARDRGFTKITLHARESAAGFYQKLDYDTQGEPFLEVGLAHRLMTKNL